MGFEYTLAKVSQFRSPVEVYSELLHNTKLANIWVNEVNK
ncbi:MAG: hypothetical protein DID92_2727744648 [Candidatus Nitrotoga sp. SPKER]|nr:MAG: hypothetical protein DID92_2727744648 [Candidatus Nitrotoga sp. SPKER]